MENVSDHSLNKYIENLNIQIFRLTIIIANVSGHNFIRKWMLLSNPQDKGGDEKEPVGVVNGL